MWLTGREGRFTAQKAEDFTPSKTGDEMLIYKVFYKNFQLKKGEFMGILVERRNNTRGMSFAESGLRWAKLTFGRLEKNEKSIFVVPNEMNLSNDATWLADKWMFTKEELLGLAKFVEQGIRG